MEPAPRARLCQLDPPRHSPEEVVAMRRLSARRSRSSSALATSMPAAVRASLPSRCASFASGPKRPSGPASASTALARFMRSLRYFHRMMSSRATDWKVEVAMASAMALPVASTPDGYRPRSSMPETGAEWIWTTPARSWVAGHITHIP